MTEQLVSHERIELKHMTFEQIEQMLIGIRERRMSAANAFIQAQELAFTVKIDKLKVKLDKEMKMFEKEDASLAKAIDKVEARAVKLHAIKQELDFMTSNNLIPTEDEDGQSETEEVSEHQ